MRSYMLIAAALMGVIDGASAFAAVVLSRGVALGDSISNLSQVVGMDLTQELCQAMPSGSGFANWETTALATLRAIRMGDATNFVANSTPGMLSREFEVVATNAVSVPATFTQAFSLTSSEFSRYRVTAYAVTTNSPGRVCVDINVLLRRGDSQNDIPETLNLSLIKTNDVWKVDGL